MDQRSLHIGLIDRFDDFHAVTAMRDQFAVMQSDPLTTILVFVVLKPLTIWARVGRLNLSYVGRRDLTAVSMLAAQSKLIQQETEQTLFVEPRKFCNRASDLIVRKP